MTFASRWVINGPIRSLQQSIQHHLGGVSEFLRTLIKSKVSFLVLQTLTLTAQFLALGNQLLSA